MFDPMIPYSSINNSTNGWKYRQSMGWKLGRNSLLECISNSTTPNNNNNKYQWYTSNHHHYATTATISSSLSSHHYHQIEFISSSYNNDDDDIIIAAHDSTSLDILSSSSSSCSTTPLVSKQSLSLSFQKVEKMKSISNNDSIVIGCNNGQYHIYSINNDNNNNNQPIYSSSIIPTTSMIQTRSSLWDFQTNSSNVVMALYGNSYTNTIYGMDSRDGGGCHSFVFSPKQQLQSNNMTCLTFTSNNQIAIGSNKNILSLYDLRMLPSSHHTDTKCCQQYTIQTNHINVQISQTSLSSSSLEVTHDDENYSIANLSSNDNTDSICISMRTNDSNNNNDTNNQDGLVWTRDILFHPQDDNDYDTNTIMTTMSSCCQYPSQQSSIPFPVLSKHHDIMACYHYHEDNEEEIIHFYNDKQKNQRSKPLERTKLIGTKRRLYQHQQQQKSSSNLSPSLRYPLQHQDNYGLSSNLTCMAFDQQGTSFIYGLDNGEIYLYQGIK